MSVGNVKLNVTGGSASYDHISSTSTADDADIDEEVSGFVYLQRTCRVTHIHSVIRVPFRCFVSSIEALLF